MIKRKDRYIMEIKIKSITDVITNSSSEVFICKISDLEEAKKELKDVSDKLAQVQLALDLTNSTMSFDIPE